MRPITITAVLAAAALSLTACSGSTTPGTVGSAEPAPDQSLAASAGSDPAAELEAAAATAGTTRSARVAMDYTMTSGGRTVSYTLTGLMSMDGLTIDVTGVLPAAQTGAPEDVTMHEILSDGMLYIHYQGGGAPDVWFKTKYDPAGDAAQAAGTDVGEQLRAMSMLNDLEKVGPEQIRGMGTTHYRGTMDMSMVSKTVAGMGGTSGASAAPGSDAVPVDVWLDGKRRIVRESIRMDTMMRGQMVSTAVVMDFSDWGVPLKIKVPTKTRPLSDLTSARSG